MSVMIFTEPSKGFQISIPLLCGKYPPTIATNVFPFKSLIVAHELKNHGLISCKSEQEQSKKTRI